MNFLDMLKSQIYNYLTGAINLQMLREWFAPYSIDPERYGDPKATRISYEMMSDFSDLDEGLLPERSLRMNLQNLYEPLFASSYSEIKLQFGGYSGWAPARTESLIREAVAA
jgi:hypothetical protein